MRMEVWRATNRARKWLEESGYNPVQEPLEALQALAGEVVAAKDYFASQIDVLRYESNTGEQLRAEVALYERALDRCIRVLETLARLGIADRRTQIAEAQAVILAQGIETILDRLSLDPQQRTLALTVVPEVLREITASEPERREWDPESSVAGLLVRTDEPARTR